MRSDLRIAVDENFAYPRNVNGANEITAARYSDGKRTKKRIDVKKSSVACVDSHGCRASYALNLHLCTCGEEED